MFLHRISVCPVALFAVGVTSAQAVWADEEITTWRIFFADQATPTVTALDLDAPENRWTFDLAGGPARIHVSPSGEAIIAVQPEDGKVDFIRTGIALDDHGDHADMEVTDPSASGLVLDGPRPFHVVKHDDVFAINYDRGGYADFFDEHEFLEGDIEGERFAQSRAHHGYAIPVGDYIIGSVASDVEVEAGKLPPRAGIQAFDHDGNALGEMQVCTNLHGEAFSGDYLLSGCKEGVIAVNVAGAAPEFTMLPYPADFPEATTGTLLGASAMQIFLGNYGADSVVVVDPTAEPYFSRVELPFRRVDFVLDPARPQFAYILTEDGMLHRLNMLSAEIEQSALVTQAYSMEGPSSTPRPRLAVAGDRIVMTDPLAALLRVIDPDSLEEIGLIAVEGLPFYVHAVGGSGLSH